MWSSNTGDIRTQVAFKQRGVRTQVAFKQRWSVYMRGLMQIDGGSDNYLLGSLMKSSHSNCVMPLCKSYCHIKKHLTNELLQ